MNLTIRYDDTVHKKLRIIAAYQYMSLNALIMKTLAEKVSDWERKHGEIKLPE